MKLQYNEGQSFAGVHLIAENIAVAALLMRLGANCKKGEISIRSLFSGNEIQGEIFVRYRKDKRTSIGNNV